MTGRKILEAVHVKKIYNYRTMAEFEALHDISFSVMEGEFVGIMGPSGSGKSTFINNISTIDECTEGKVIINGRNVRAMSSKEIAGFRYENLGFIFQDFNLLSNHTIFENIALPLSLAGTGSRETAERVEELAQELGIREILNRLPDECSGGERQRAAVCRALINHPCIIMADEPTGNLDSTSSAEVLGILREMNRTKGVTIVMVTHDPMIASYTDRIAYIRDGSIESVLERGQDTQERYYRRITALNSRELMPGASAEEKSISWKEAACRLYMTGRLSVTEIAECLGIREEILTGMLQTAGCGEARHES